MCALAKPLVQSRAVGLFATFLNTPPQTAPSQRRQQHPNHIKRSFEGSDSVDDLPEPSIAKNSQVVIEKETPEQVGTGPLENPTT